MSKKSRNISEVDRRKLAIKLAAFVYNFVPIRKKEAFNNIKTAFPEMNHHWINKQLKGTYQIVINNFIDFLSFSLIFDNWFALVFPMEINGIFIIMCSFVKLLQRYQMVFVHNVLTQGTVSACRDAQKYFDNI